MINLYLYVLAVFGGIAVAIQAQMMSLLDRQLGTAESVFLTYGVGALGMVAIILALRGGNLPGWSQFPWTTALASGLLGLVIVGTISFNAPRIGLVATFTLIVATQFISISIIDHFGLFGADLRPLGPDRILGVATLLLGVWLIIR